MSHPARSVSGVEHRRIWRGLDADLFRFTTTDGRDLHTAVMSAFEHSAVTAPALDIDQVRRAVHAVGWDEPGDDGALERALHQLTTWGLLEATQNHSASYASPEDFERKNLQWSLTRRGEAAISGVLHAFDQLRSAIGLQPAVLDAIGDRLADLADLLAGPQTDERASRVHLVLAEVENHLAALVASVRQFNGHLQTLLRDDATDDAVFLDVKRRTVTYLEEYAEGVERRHRRVRLGIERLGEIGVPVLFDVAVVGANLAPSTAGDPRPGWIAERRRRWSGLEDWFAPPDGSEARIAGLLGIARTAIVELLRVLERRWDQRRRSASVAGDLRRLAGWFAGCAGDEEAHRLFGVAFGMWPARHAHLAPLDGEARSPRLSWAETTPVDVAPALRTSGSLANRGRVRPLRDPGVLRAERQRQQAQALHEHRIIRAALATDGAVRLSHFGRLPEPQFSELLDLLAIGLDAERSSDGARRAVSLDGQVEIVLTDAGDGRRARLVTESGELTGPDFVVTITLVDAAERPGGAAPAAAAVPDGPSAGAAAAFGGTTIELSGVAGA
jgi:uncharacterized protein (TIGR02677 family)